MKEMPLAALLLAWRSPRIWLLIFSETASPGGIVAGAHDAQPRGELLHVLVEALRVHFQLAVGKDRAHVVIDDHVILLECRAPPTVSVRALPLCPTGSVERLAPFSRGDSSSPPSVPRRQSD